jgi:hypothetical protein
MKWLRFTIAQVMIVVLYAAIGFSAFRTAGDALYGKTLTNAFFMLSVGILAIATLMTFFRDGRSRTSWLGFALFGWLHLQYGWPNAGGPAYDVPWRPWFPHTRVISILFMKLGILFSGSTEQGSQRWGVLQSATMIATAFLGALIGDIVAIRPGRSNRRPDVRLLGMTHSLILGLIALCFYVALGLEAYSLASDTVTYGRLLDNTYFLVTVGSLAIAALMSTVREGRSRARWMAFARFGWLHVEFGWPDSTLNDFGVRWRAEFPHVVLLAGQLEGQLSPITNVSNMFRWHVIQSSLTMASAIFGAVIVNFLPIVPGRRDGEAPNPSHPADNPPPSDPTSPPPTEPK